MTHSRMVTRPARAAIARVGGVRARSPSATLFAQVRLRPRFTEERPVWSRQYGADVLADGGTAGGLGRRRPGQRGVPKVEAERGLVVEDSEGRFCGAVVGYEKGAVTLEDRHGKRRVFPLAPAAFLLDGKPVTLIPPAAPAAPGAGTRTARTARTASG